MFADSAATFSGFSVKRSKNLFTISLVKSIPDILPENSDPKDPTMFYVVEPIISLNVLIILALISLILICIIISKLKKRKLSYSLLPRIIFFYYDYPIVYDYRIFLASILEDDDSLGE